MLVFEVDNSYSWLREKIVSYRITVTPPSAEILMSGRRRRAKACQTVVEEDLSSAQERLAATLSQKKTLEQEVAKLEKELEEKKKSLEVAEKEEKWLINRVKLRKEQKELLKKRLTEGWEDERSED
jgi:chromosome segregation ATPase